MHHASFISPFLFRIFRKKKRVRRSFSNLFSLSTSKSWLHGNIFGDVDSSLSEDTWLEGVRRLDMEHCNETGESESPFPQCNIIHKWAAATMLFRTNINSRDDYHCIEGMGPIFKKSPRFSPHYLRDPVTYVFMSRIMQNSLI